MYLISVSINIENRWHQKILLPFLMFYLYLFTVFAIHSFVKHCFEYYIDYVLPKYISCDYIVIALCTSLWRKKSNCSVKVSVSVRYLQYLHDCRILAQFYTIQLCRKISWFFTYLLTYIIKPRCPMTSFCKQFL